MAGAANAGRIREWAVHAMGGEAVENENASRLLDARLDAAVTGHAPQAYIGSEGFVILPSDSGGGGGGATRGDAERDAGRLVSGIGGGSRRNGIGSAGAGGSQGGYGSVGGSSVLSYGSGYPGHGSESDIGLGHGSASHRSGMHRGAPPSAGSQRPIRLSRESSRRSIGLDESPVRVQEGLPSRGGAGSSLADGGSDRVGRDRDGGPTAMGRSRLAGAGAVALNRHVDRAALGTSHSMVSATSVRSTAPGLGLGLRLEGEDGTRLGGGNPMGMSSEGEGHVQSGSPGTMSGTRASVLTTHELAAHGHDIGSHGDSGATFNSHPSARPRG